LKVIAELYNKNDFSVIKEFNPWNTDDDKRFVFLIKFTDEQELAIKVCRNTFTTDYKVSEWKKLCKTYLDLGIYCPQIITSINCTASETIIIDNEEYLVYAEEIKKYKTYEEISSELDFETIKSDVIESIGKVAANCTYLLPFPSVFCVYDTFDSQDVIDENYQNAESFCKTVKEHFEEYSSYADNIWNLFLLKRKTFEPIHKKLPKASFQSDLNWSNILVDDNMNFAGYIDFNLCGTETVLSYIVISEVCGYMVKKKDIEFLTDENFLKNCDNYFYKNIEIIKKHYKFTEFERENICLCYNTVYPFSCWAINSILDYVIKENQSRYVKSVLDWVYYQLNRNDILDI
jgi:hypothetical protein